MLQVCPVDVILVIELRGELLIIFAIRDLLKTDRMRGRETTDLLVKMRASQSLSSSGHEREAPNCERRKRSCTGWMIWWWYGDTLICGGMG